MKSYYNKNTQILMSSIMLLILVFFIQPFLIASALLVPSEYNTIEGAIAAASDGDSIIVSLGTYTPEGGQLVIDKAITLEAESSLDKKPIIKTNFNGWTQCAIQIAADNVTLAGFEIDNSAAGNLSGYIVGDYNDKKNGWTVKYCDIHDGRNAIRVMGDNVTIEYCNLYNTSSDLINGEYGNCFGLTVKYNQLHSENPTSGGKPAGVTYSCSSTSGDDVEISYNYCWASRTFVDFQNNGSSLAPSNKIKVIHNTVDSGMEKTPEYSTKGQAMSIAWWADQGNWNGPNFVIKDNIFSRQRWYQVVDTDKLLKGQITLTNNLFWLWYQDDSEAPYTHEWPSKNGAVGWQDMGAGNEFIVEKGITTDPKYKASDKVANLYYALQNDSPAMGTASDGTNIGAWQGVSVDPVVKKVSPGSGSPGKTVTITGSAFTGVQTVLFGKKEAEITDKSKDNIIKAIVPEGPLGKEVDITVITPQGSGVLPDGFRYKSKKEAVKSI